jgi:lipoprotein NlpI
MKQFSRYHRVGAADIENGLWWFLCMAEDEGIAKARAEMLEYPGRVRGQPFPALLALYLDEGSAEAVLEAATRGTVSVRQRRYDLFNAHYYLSKYYEIVGQKDEALRHVREALAHEIPHFMYACAEADALRLGAGRTPAATK